MLFRLCHFAFIVQRLLHHKFERIRSLFLCLQFVVQYRSNPYDFEDMQQNMYFYTVKVHNHFLAKRSKTITRLNPIIFGLE